jgi:hypothetical protein
VNKPKQSRIRFILFFCHLIICVFFVFGCSALSLIPLTLQEIKLYVFGQQESFSYPIDKVMASAIYSLKLSGFTVFRVEHFNGKGLINASWKNATVELLMEPVTPKLTKVINKIQMDAGFREYSSEEEVFESMRKTLEEERVFDWSQLTRGMSPVHFSPNDDSVVIGYLGPGEETEIMKQQGKWFEIEMMDDHSGFVGLNYLKVKQE